MRIPLSKLKAILLYFSDNTDQRYLGKVKMMKLLYYLDFTHFKKYGMPVTGDTYKNLEHGPIPSTIKNLVDAVESEPENALLSDVITIETARGQNIHRVVGKRHFTVEDAKLFSDSELDIIKEISRRFKSVNTETIEAQSHNEAPWKLTKLLDTIPYELATKDPDSEISKEELYLLSQI